MNAAEKPKFSLFGRKKPEEQKNTNITSIEFEPVSSVNAARGGALVSTRLLLLVLALALPLAFVVFLLIGQQQQEINFSLRERDGASYLRSVGTLLQRFSEHRNLVTQQRTGGSAAIQARQKKAEEINTLFSTTDTLDNRFGAAFKTTEIYGRVKSSWRTLEENIVSSSPEANFESHNRLIRTEMFDLIRTIANNSNLILDPVLETYYTVDLTTDKLPTIVDDIGQLAGLGMGVLTRKRIFEDEQFRINALLSRVRNGLAEAERSAAFAAAANPKDLNRFNLQTLGFNRATQATLTDVVETNFIQGLSESNESSAVGFTTNNPTAAFGSNVFRESFIIGMDRILTNYYSLYDNALATLNTLLERRVASLQNTQRLVLLGLFVLLILVLLFTFFTIRSITRPLGEMSQVAEKFGSGDLSQVMPVRSRDEIGQLGVAFNNSVVQLRDFVEAQRQEALRSKQLQENIGEFLNVAMDISGGDLTKKGKVSEDVLGNVVDAINLMTEEIGYLLKDVQTTTEQVNNGARQLTHASRNIVQGAVSQEEIAQQAGREALEVSQEFEGLTATASDTATIAQRTLEASREGQTAVQETLTGMNAIRREVSNISKSVKGLSDRSLEIQEIVDTISGIAAQTNLLSLNAAIEASGAGEAGARFAIVADEVRRLAEDSAKSTSRVAGLIKSIQTEIQGLVVGIEDGTKEVESGYRIASQAGNQLEQIAQLAQQSSEFASRISQVTQSQIGRVQTVTQAVQTIAATAQAAREQSQSGQTNAEQLRLLAQNLASNLERFRLPS
jgi:twitching motility protein PilJ